MGFRLSNRINMAQKCISCRVQFATAPDHRAHFQSEWHCYNLKRKIATMPPLTRDEFEERKELASKQENEKKNVKGQKKNKMKINVLLIYRQLNVYLMERINARYH